MWVSMHVSVTELHLLHGNASMHHDIIKHQRGGAGDKG